METRTNWSATAAVAMGVALLMFIWLDRKPVAAVTAPVIVEAPAPASVVSATAFETQSRLLRAAVVALARHGMLVISEDGSVILPPLEPQAATP